MPQAHAAQNNDIGISLKADAGQQFIIRLAGHGENRQFLRFDQRVENVNHGNARLHHLVGHHAAHRIHRRRADIHTVGLHRRTAVARNTGAVKNPAQQIITEGHLHRFVQKLHPVARADALRARKHLQVYLRAFQTNHLGQ